MARILFIEDEEFTAQSFIDELRELDHDVDIVIGGEEAIRCLNEGDHDFDLIVLDIMLPRGNHKGSPAIPDDVKTGEMGIEVLRQLREELDDDTPVIVFTAVVDDDVKIQALAYGIEKYFTKPTRLNDFIDAVERALTPS